MTVLVVDVCGDGQIISCIGRETFEFSGLRIEVDIDILAFTETADNNRSCSFGNTGERQNSAVACDARNRGDRRFDNLAVFYVFDQFDIGNLNGGVGRITSEVEEKQNVLQRLVGVYLRFEVLNSSINL